TGGTGDQYSLGINTPAFGGAYDEQKLQEMTGTETMSYQDWAQTQDRGTLRNAEYSTLKFPKPEDRQMAEDYNSELSKNTTLAYKRDSLPWDLISEDNKTEFNNRIDGYSDSTFKDFFFGGGAFDHSNRRMH
ncbi:MAG TPA: hypothetical protein DEG69_04625, partial [Flavobacteriaceae bacterium]|nr:hypothetical protein [Flavobacteriaceae bacterium]